MPDFFPLVKGAERRYATSSARGWGFLTLEVLSVETAGDQTAAQCRKTVQPGDAPPTVEEFEALKNAAEVRSGDGIEFKFPLAKGTEWIVSPRRYWIEALDDAVETPAGRFTGCLRVAYLIAEGDGGSGERWYAPGVGLVKIVENDEGDPYTHELISRAG